MSENNNMVKKEDAVAFPIKMDDQEDSGTAFEFLNPLLKYGQFSTALSYDVQKSNIRGGKDLDYGTKRPRTWGAISMLFYVIICLNQFLVVVKFDFSVSYSKLVNMIKRVTYGIFAIKLIIVYFCLHHYGKNKGLWEKILKQADTVQREFAKFGIHFPCTQAVNIAISGLVLTYTVIVNQVATQ